MICYKDMTFCTHSECLTVECNRHASQIKHPVDLPIAYASFKATCGKYQREIIRQSVLKDEDDTFYTLTTVESPSGAYIHFEQQEEDK